MSKKSNNLDDISNDSDLMIQKVPITATLFLSDTPAMRRIENTHQCFKGILILKNTIIPLYCNNYNNYDSSTVFVSNSDESIN